MKVSEFKKCKMGCHSDVFLKNTCIFCCYFISNLLVPAHFTLSICTIFPVYIHVVYISLTCSIEFAFVYFNIS